MVSVTLYGGVDEIGGNKILLEHEGRRIFLDFGMSFGKVGNYFAEFLKPRTRASLTDLMRVGALPALDGVYRQDCCRLDGVEPLVAEHGYADLWTAPVESYEDYKKRQGRPFVDAVILSHAHMDHFGHFGYLDPEIPIFSTPITLTALRAVAKLSRRGIENEVIDGKTVFPDLLKSGPCKGEVTIRGTRESAFTRSLEALEPYAATSIPGTPFTVTMIPVDHSIPGAASILVEAGGRTVYYSGDVRFHGIYEEETRRLREIVAGLEPDLFLCEGTRLGRPSDDAESRKLSEKSDNEDDVRRTLLARFREARGLCLVDFAWKDTTRFETLARVAADAGRTLVVSYKVAYMMRKLNEADPSRFATVESYGNVRVYLRRYESMRYAVSDYADVPLRLGYWEGTWKTAPAASENPDVLQHYRSGVKAPEIRRNPDRFILMLSQWEMQDLVDLEPPAGSVFVRAACEPFSEEMDLDLQRQARWLSAFGIPVNDGRAGREPIPEALHASGHASGPDILDFVKRVGAARVVPVHTEHAEAFDGVANEVVRARIGEAIRV